MRAEDLITYCGVYGGTCARWCGNITFRKLAATLAESVDAQGFTDWMPAAVREFDFTEFRKALDFFSRNGTWLVCKNCCKGGDGRPNCEIRNCCKQRRLDVCFDCDEFPCDKVQGNSKMIERAKDYRKLGKDLWLQQQIEKAGQGYELHTEKYYKINVEPNPICESTSSGATPDSREPH